MFDNKHAILTLSEVAASHVRGLIAKGGDGVIGLRVGIKTAGCSGLKYEVNYAYDKKPFEDIIEDKGVQILIDPAAVMFLIGSEMDWQEDKFSSGFVFKNPNEISRCGCGESFSVAQ